MNQTTNQAFGSFYQKQEWMERYHIFGFFLPHHSDLSFSWDTVDNIVILRAIYVLYRDKGDPITALFGTWYIYVYIYISITACTLIIKLFPFAVNSGHIFLTDLLSNFVIQLFQRCLYLMLWINCDLKHVLHFSLYVDTLFINTIILISSTKLLILEYVVLAQISF